MPDGRRLYRRQLARPIQQLNSAYDVVIVGSGYGGGICAARLAGHGKSVCLLERGREFRAQGKRRDFPFDDVLETARELNFPANPLGLFDIRLGEEVDVVVGCGLGGTSLINANVMYLPEAALFEGNRWPPQITSTGLQKYYDLVKKELRAEPYSPTLPLKAQRLREVAAGEGAWKLPPIAVTTQDFPQGAAVDMLRCVECGSCASGCNFAAKNTVDMTYLPKAEAAGAEIFTRTAVKSVRKDRSTGRYVLHYVHHGEAGTINGTLNAKVVVLSAGVLGSTEILLRSKAEHDLEVPSSVGTQFSGNADLLGLAYNNDARAAIDVGPTIISSVEYWQSGTFSDHFIIEEGAMPKPLLDVVGQAAGGFAGLGWGVDTDPNEDEFAEWLRTVRDLDGFDQGGALDHSLIFLGIGHDSASGRMELDSHRDRIIVKYPGYPAEAVFSRLSDAMEKITKALGGSYIKSPRWSRLLGNNLTTVHPLGGCPMDGKDSEKVVNHLGQVHGHKDLYVVDGAILPTAVGVNPAFTISAVAERIAEHLGTRLSQL